MISLILVLVLLVVTISAIVNQNILKSQSNLALLGSRETQSLARSGIEVLKGITFTSGSQPIREAVKANLSAGGTFYFGTPSSKTPPQPTFESVNTALKGVAVTAQGPLDEVTCNSNLIPDPKQGGQVALKVYLTSTACKDTLKKSITLSSPTYLSGVANSGNLSAVQNYQIPFLARSQGQLGSFKQDEYLRGYYRVSVGNAPFTRWALFSNTMVNTSNQDVYFNSNDLFGGPVHVNAPIHIAGNPYFGRALTTASCKAITFDSCLETTSESVHFQAEGPLQVSALAPSPLKPCYGSGDCPDLFGGVDYQAAFIALPADADNAPLKDAQQVVAGYSRGQVFNSDVMWMELYRDTNEAGNESQYIDMCLNPFICGTLMFDPKTTTLYQKRETPLSCYLTPCTDLEKHWLVLSGQFGGVIYVKGTIYSLSAKDPGEANIASKARLTIAATGDITITSSLQYTVSPCSDQIARQDGVVAPAHCPQPNAINMLGVYSHNGNIYIDGPPATTLYLTAALMARKGSIQAKDLSTRDKSTLNVLGAITENNMHQLNDFDPSMSSWNHGYRLVLDFDPRFGDNAQLSPPGWPTTQGLQVLSVVTSLNDPESLRRK